VILQMKGSIFVSWDRVCFALLYKVWEV
jgi:hypothetical protein